MKIASEKTKKLPKVLSDLKISMEKRRRNKLPFFFVCDHCLGHRQINEIFIGTWGQILSHSADNLGNFDFSGFRHFQQFLPWFMEEKWGVNGVMVSNVFGNGIDTQGNDEKFEKALPIRRFGGEKLDVRPQHLIDKRIGAHQGNLKKARENLKWT